MAKGDWPRAYVIPSLALSGTAAALLIWHVLDPAARVDGWTVTLLVVMFLPWLRTVFESIEFPGGGSVTWRREVVAEQVRQAEEIQAMRFLLARFLTKPERELLQRLASGDPIDIDTDDERQGQRIARDMNSLDRSGMVSIKPDIAAKAKSGISEKFEVLSIGALYDVSDSGRVYLDLIAKLPDDERSSSTT